MKRRTLLVSLAAGALAPLASIAQAPGKIWRIGFLSQRHVDFVDADYYYGPFTQGLRELGYVAGKNLVIEWRSAEGKPERLPDLAAELVGLKVDVLVTATTTASLAAQKATVTIPIVMANMGDPVGNDLVKSLAHPGGNSTGVSNMYVELGPKLLELLRETVPKVSRVAALVNPSNGTSNLWLKNVQSAAQKIGLKLLPIEAGTPQEITNGFAAMTRQNAGALIVARDSFFSQQKDQIAGLAAKHRLPSIGGYYEYVEAGGLMSYGNNVRETYRRAATYVDKIIKGAKAGELPVEQPMRFDMAVNMKTAKALGIKVPHTILIRATNVIE